MTFKFFLNTLLAALFIFSANVVSAKDYQIGDLKISGTWARASAGPAKTGAAYVTMIMNTGKKMDRLLSVASPIARRVEIHTNIVENGIAKMRQIKALEIHPGHSATLKPGGNHIMFMGLKAPLKTGQTFPLTLIFEKAGKLDVIVDVKKIGSGHKMNMKMKMKH